MKQAARNLAPALSALLLSACALAPGMYAGDLERGATVVARDPATGRGVPVNVVPLSAAQLQSDVAATGEMPPRATPSAYKLGPGDVVSITVWEHPELTIPQGEFRSADAAGNLIDSSGALYYPYCGLIQAAGLTRAQLRADLQNCLTAVIRRPQVDVRIIQFRSQRVHVGGAVAQPGAVPLNDVPVYLSDAIAGAGGVTPQANPRFVTLSRDGRSYTMDMQQYARSGDEALNPLLRPGDTVYVSYEDERRVAVLGEVLVPQVLPLDEGLHNLADALAAARGLNPASAEPQRILVLRAEQAENTVYWLRANNPLELAAAQQFRLAPGDVIYVDQTGLTRWNKVISQMLPGAITSIGNTAAISSTR